MEFSQVCTDRDSLTRYAGLFKECFPQAVHLHEPAYLEWLYARNPDGPAVGYDAFEGTQLAAHYVCVPSSVSLRGHICRGLLSLNTATHPQFQGKGLFTKLASLTYSSAVANGFEAVYGVANANSTPGFTRKLGFNLVTSLDARLGLGDISFDRTRARSESEFTRIWRNDALTWRASNPMRPIDYCLDGAGNLNAFARVNALGLRAYAPLCVDSDVKPKISQPVPSLSPRVFLGAIPECGARFNTLLSVPQRFRPSPLNFIFLPLNTAVSAPARERLLFTFLDFDAY